MKLGPFIHVAGLHYLHFGNSWVTADICGRQTSEKAPQWPLPPAIQVPVWPPFLGSGLGPGDSLPSNRILRRQWVLLPWLGYRRLWLPSCQKTLFLALLAQSATLETLNSMLAVAQRGAVGGLQLTVSKPSAQQLLRNGISPIPTAELDSRSFPSQTLSWEHSPKQHLACSLARDAELQGPAKPRRDSWPTDMVRLQMCAVSYSRN